MNEWGNLKGTVLAEMYHRDNIVNLWKLINTHHNHQFPNLITLATLALTSAVHTAGCERGFRVQNRILTKYRTRMNVDKQDKVMRIKLKSGEINNENAIKVWREENERRLYKLKAIDLAIKNQNTKQ